MWDWKCCYCWFAFYQKYCKRGDWHGCWCWCFILNVNIETFTLTVRFVLGLKNMQQMLSVTCIIMNMMLEDGKLLWFMACNGMGSVTRNKRLTAIFILAYWNLCIFSCIFIYSTSSSKRIELLAVKLFTIVEYFVFLII
jgi:hypothetical protein